MTPPTTFDPMDLHTFIGSLAPCCPGRCLGEACEDLGTSGKSRRRLAWLRDFSQFVNTPRCRDHVDWPLPAGCADGIAQGGVS